MATTSRPCATTPDSPRDDALNLKSLFISAGCCRPSCRVSAAQVFDYGLPAARQCPDRRRFVQALEQAACDDAVPLRRVGTGAGLDDEIEVQRQANPSIGRRLHGCRALRATRDGSVRRSSTSDSEKGRSRDIGPGIRHT
jgi:hypothetical protein